MPGLRLVSLAFLAMIASSCRSAADPPEPAGGRVLFAGGRIYPDAFAAAPVAALLARGGRVVAAGEESELRARAAGEPLAVVDLAGGTAVPGLVDAHGHLAGYGEALESVDLVACRSYAEVIARIAAQAARQPPGTWITGRGWDQTLWADPAFPHHGPLSEAVPAHPVLVRRIDGHAALANALALARAGLAGLVAAPRLAAGEVHVGGDGRATGVLIDAAMDLVAAHVPPPNRATIERRILAAQEALLAQGLAGIHDMGAGELVLDVLEDLDRSGRLRLRVIEYVWANDGLSPVLAARYPRPADRDGRRRLRVIGAKLMVDGALGSRGAALFADYSDEPGERGLLMLDEARFASLLEAVVEAGLQPAAHAIGDRANRLVLDAYARRAAQDPSFRARRPRLEHAQVVAEADWPRFAALGVIPSMQPTHATSDMRWAEERLGADRLAGAYAWRRLPGPGAPLALGSDFPVESPDPRRGLYAAATRQDEAGRPPGGWLPGQRLALREALAGFTTGAAWAAHEEDVRGRLAPGTQADLTVLDVDPLAGDPSRLLSAQVLLTVVDGEIVYRRGVAPNVSEVP
ncbi:MAG: amidohydrolase [Planctomycetota bacterium]